MLLALSTVLGVIVTVVLAPAASVPLEGVTVAHVLGVKPVNVTAQPELTVPKLATE